MPSHHSLFTRLRGAGPALALCTILACGGGGGSSSNKTTDTTPNPSSTVAGAAAKGIIRNGTVNAYELVKGAWTLRGTASTDHDGAYSLTTAGYAGGPARLTLTWASGSTMVWDGATGNGHTFGVEEPLPNTFAMSAVLPALNTTGTTSAPITPYTNLADGLVEATLAAGGTPDVRNAIGRVNVLVGFDVASVPAVDVTSPTAMAAASPSAQKAAVMAAAVTSLAGNGTVAKAVADLAESMAGGAFTSASTITIGALTRAWTAAAGNPDIAANLGASASTDLAATVLAVNTASQGGAYTPVIPVNAPTTQVALAKGLIGDTRSLAYDIATSTTTPVKALGLDLDSAAGVFNRDTAAITGILGIGLEQALVKLGSPAAFQAELEAQNSVTLTVPVTAGGGQALGTLTMTASNPRSLTVTLAGTLSGTASGGRTVAVNASLATGLDINQINLANATSTQTSLQVNSLSASVTAGSTSLAITGGSLAATLTASGTSVFVTSLSLTDLAMALQSGSAGFTGKASIDFVNGDPAYVSTYEHSPYELFCVKHVALDGSFTLADASLGTATATASIALDIANAARFDLYGFLNAGDRIDFSTYGMQLSSTDAARLKAASRVASANYSWDIYYYPDPWGGMTAYSGGTSLVNNQYVSVNPNGTDDYSALVKAYDVESAFSSSLASFPAGYQVLNRYLYTSSGGWGYGGITVQLPAYTETSANFLDATLSAAFTTSGIKGLPVMQVTAVATRGSLTGGTSSITLAWGANTYKIDVNVTDATANKGSVTVSNPATGVQLVLQDITLDGGSGALYVGGAKVAEVTRLADGLIMVTYTDGTFESFQ